MKVYFFVSLALLLAAVVVFAVGLSGMGSGRHFGAAVLGGIAVWVCGALAVNALVAGLAWWRPGWGVTGVVVALIALALLIDPVAREVRRYKARNLDERRNAVAERLAGFSDEGLRAWLAAGEAEKHLPEGAGRVLQAELRRRLRGCRPVEPQTAAALRQRMLPAFALEALDVLAECPPEARVATLETLATAGYFAGATAASMGPTALRFDPSGRWLSALRERGTPIDLEARGETGDTPLLAWSRYPTPESARMVRSLLDAGADARATDKEGHTARWLSGESLAGRYGKEWEGLEPNGEEVLVLRQALVKALREAEQAPAKGPPR